ncbi:sugar transferase [Edaphobacter sp. 12200R-103]|jgi:exopolysaccharide biosynthesis polyprenyl glycosylphosphotransferase|uniref:sugar transferase n=1 Tax=Edaphobacter sp. 12200R-103 TaxID=2703788 RepID=UPI00138B7754|nr:sugar transferase [Edaphobacter sp. 12200R-103]QHS51494.1 sugar transferase [Edaphobacter sp. 12200R-103]
MATPDYLQQVIVSGRRSAVRNDRDQSASSAILRRPSSTSLIWASLDLATVLVAALVALRVHVSIPAQASTSTVLFRIFHVPAHTLLLYLLWYALCLIFFSRSYGLYGPLQNRSGLHEQRMTVQASLTAGLILCGTLYLSNGGGVSRTVVALTVILSTALLCLRRAIQRRSFYRRSIAGFETRNVLIVGAGRVGHALRNHLDSLQHLGYRFKGFVALTEREAELGDVEVIGDVRNCLSLARSLFVDEIFFSVPGDKKLIIGIVEEARQAGIDVRVVPDLYDGLAWNAPVEYIGQFPTIPLHRREFPMGGFLIKRVLDITLSSIALALLSPIILTIALAVRLDSEGAIFYRAHRIGRKGRTFSCYKFRTMVQDADKLKEKLAHMNERDSVLFKISNDPRITRVGRILRKYSLDELPQFYNVLRGDMSLVGPRPPIAREVEQYELDHLRRLEVLPGITGLWQVEARQDPSFDSYISLDTAYVENWSLWLDIKILARTVGVVFAGTGS